ncbi:hypothetical protein M407DRAFT_24407 [Tulasnella calospora MUT 4182]|uniref:Protein kinase domain-containing protein n=1 Tax=Tulasnella calospora MUT 4182 TaxID=1051891 RepID=A0A0C3QI08_9AGAM|nr:hypothetical protein M407DRAFT_24407 [Tulasnella calospora MUT 4182]
MQGGNLFKLVVGQRTEQNQGLLNTLAHKVAKDLLGGLKYIHSKGIAHRNLKQENLLIPNPLHGEGFDSFSVVIGDFGLAGLSDDTGTTTFEGGSPNWMPPRFMRDPAVPDYQMDLWGMALIIWLAGLPKPWGTAGLPLFANCPNQLKWGWLNKLRITSDCINSPGLFLVESLEACGTLEDAEKHPWIRHGKSIKQIAEGEENAIDVAADIDSEPEESSGYEFDDKYDLEDASLEQMID